MATKSRIPVRVTKVSRSMEKATCMQGDDKPSICSAIKTADDITCLQTKPNSKAKHSTKSGSTKSSMHSKTKPTAASHAVPATSERKLPLNWNSASKHHKKTPVESHKIQRVPTISRVAKPRTQQVVGAKHSNSSATQVTLSCQPFSKHRGSSLVEQQQAMGIAFEADSQALDSILTGRGVTAPLLDRTASLNVPAGVRNVHAPGPRKGGSMFGTRPSVYASCESRFNFRDGLIQRKPTSDARQNTEPSENLVPVVTPFRESGYRNIYKVPERHSVYVKYVTEDELCAPNIRQFQLSSSRSTIATPGRVRIGFNKPPTLETPYLENKDDVDKPATSARHSLPLRHDICPQKDDDPIYLQNVLEKCEVPRDNLRRTLTFAENDTEGTVACTHSNGTSGQRMQVPPALLDGAAPMTRLSEADEEELLGIEEMERRLQIEIEAMEQAKGENLQRMAVVLQNCTALASVLVSPEKRCSGFLSLNSAGTGERMPLVDLPELQQQLLSFGSSPELLTSTSRSLALRTVDHRLELPASQHGVVSFVPCDAAVASLSSPAMTCAAPVRSIDSVAVGLSDGSVLSSAAASQQLQPAACTSGVGNGPAIASSPAGLPSDADDSFRILQKTPPAESGAGWRPLIALPPEPAACLRSQSQLIATIDRLGKGCSASGRACSDAVVAVAQRQWQSVTWPPAAVLRHTPAAFTATAASGSASGGCVCSVAAVDVRSAGSASAEVDSVGSTGVDEEDGPSTSESVFCDRSYPGVQCTPIFLLRSGTISVLDCGAYSPLLSKEATVAAASSSASVDSGSTLNLAAGGLGRLVIDELVAVPTADCTHTQSPGSISSTNSTFVLEATSSECLAQQFGGLELSVTALESEPGKPSFLPMTGAFSHIKPSPVPDGRLPCALLNPSPPILCVSAAGTIINAVESPLPNMPLDLLSRCRGCRSSPPAAPVSAEITRLTATAAIVPELVCRSSLIDIVSSAAERFETALLDEECSLYLCRASSRLHSCAPRHDVLINPVAYSLTNGDCQHFIPISLDLDDSPVRHASSPEGSAFRCYTSY